MPFQQSLENPRCARSGASPAIVVVTALAALALSRSLLAAVVPVGADGVPRVVVHYRDLNPTSHKDAERLLQRIVVAARNVCGDAASVQPLAEWVREQRCINEAVARAVGAVASDPLTTAYQNRYDLRPHVASIVSQATGRKVAQGAVTAQR